MRVSINVPDQKADPLLKQVASQLEAMQKRLQKLHSTPQESDKMFAAMAKQQDGLLRAMERLVGLVGKPNGGSDSALLDAVKGLKKTLGGLPQDLKAALNGSYKHMTQPASLRPRVTVKPEVTVNLGGLNQRLGRMEDALVQAAKKSRNRTFGSNY